MSSHAPLYEFIVMRVIPLLVIVNTVQDLISDPGSLKRLARFPRPPSTAEEEGTLW